MAQTIKLKRSATQGKVPGTGNLALGELAINTYDGRVFFKKNDGSDSIEHIVTTDSITTGSVSIVGSLVVDDITIDGSTISDSGDLTLDIGGDLNIDVDGADIILKDGGTAFGRFKRDSSDFIIKSEANNEDIIFRGQDGGSTIDALTLDMSAAGAASFNSTISATGATLTSLSSATEATSVMINSSNQLVTRELGSNAFNSTAFTTNTGTITQVNITAGDGLTGDVNTTSGAHTQTINVGVGTGLDVDSDEISLNLSALPDMTQAWTNGSDEFIVLDGGTQKRKLSSEIFGSNAFNSTAFLTSVDLTSDVTGILPSANLDSDTAHLSGTQTFSGTKTFSSTTKFNSANNQISIVDSDDSQDFRVQVNGGSFSVRDHTNSQTIFQIDNGAGANALYIKSAAIEISKPIDTSDTTQSTSKTTGALIVDGGAGIAKTLNVGEDVVAYASSDERYKDNIIPIRNPNEKIKQIGGYTFDWNDKHEVFKGKKDIGVVAQEIEKILPEIVETRDNGFKAVKYEKIVALLIESNKELIKRVEELESKVK